MWFFGRSFGLRESSLLQFGHRILDLLECIDLMQSEQKVCPQTRRSGARLWSLKYSRHTAQLRKSSDIVYDVNAGY